MEVPFGIDRPLYKVIEIYRSRYGRQLSALRKRAAMQGLRISLSEFSTGLSIFRVKIP